MGGGTRGARPGADQVPKRTAGQRMTHVGVLAPERRPKGVSPPSPYRLGGPELEVVAASLAWPRNGQARRRLQAAAQAVIDWTQVARLAERHRVVALMTHSLEDASIDIPQDVRAELRRRSLQVACEELGMAAELTRLQAAFSQATCTFTVLKGLAAAVQGFQRIGLRQNRDIDLLIDEADLPRAVAVLDGSGYEQIEPAERLSTAALRGWARAHKDLVFRKSSSGVVVELHWRLFDNVRFAAELARPPTVELQLPSGVAVRALSPEAAFAYMAAHGGQHAWSRLKWLADFAAYAAGFGERRTAELYDELSRKGLGGSVAQGLLLSHELIGLPLPQVLSRKLKSSFRLQLLRSFGLAAIGGPQVIELEDRAFGSTLKTLSRYLLSGGAGYLMAQMVLDVGDVPKSHTSPWLRRLGFFAKAPLWIWAHGLRWAKQRRRARTEKRTRRSSRR